MKFLPNRDGRERTKKQCNVGGVPVVDEVTLSGVQNINAL
jgi:hypothetical protein